MKKKVIRLNEQDIERLVKKIIKEEPMNLTQGMPYINIDDDEIEFITDVLEPGKIELHGNELYYDENDSDIMGIMIHHFPNDFDDESNRIRFGESINGRLSKQLTNKLIREWGGDGEWTEAPPEVKEFMLNNDVVRYMTEYFPEEGRKKWTINAKGQKPFEFTQDFDFSFFDKN